MPMPKAYEPQDGYRFQVLCRNQAYSREWEHCDYAKDRCERGHLLLNYRQAYGQGWEFKTIALPRKFWPKADFAAVIMRAVTESGRPLIES